MLGLLAGAPPRLVAQEDSATVVAGRRYGAGQLRERLLGAGYRELWAAPIRAEVLDLDRFGGRLRPLRQGGGRQTITLHLEGADGRRYVFRSVDKDLEIARDLGEAAGGAIARGLVQDLNSAMYPAAPVIATALQCAVGILCAPPRLVVMPDHPALGEHRELFAGMLGTIEERPNEGKDGKPGFHGFSRIVGTERLLERLAEGPAEAVDARAYLKARLFDLVLGDWDRNPDQWRWAARESSGALTWIPIPRDRDFAFVDYRGALPWIVRQYRPQAVRFDEEYRDLFGLTISSAPMDRRLLAGLSRAAWDSVADALQSAMTDSAIAVAAARAPPEYQALAGDRLTRTLASRRDRLPAVSRRFFRQLSTEVDVHATDAAEIAEIARPDPSTLQVRLFERDENGALNPFFHRIFHRDHTREVRILMGGGDDRARIHGVGRGIVVRLVGGGGDDVLLDSSRAAAGKRTSTLHDDEGNNRFVAPADVLVDRQTFVPPVGTSFTGQRYRDWGRGRMFVPSLEHRFGAGVILGGGIDVYRYGFRRAPFAHRLGIRGLYATGVENVALDLEGEFRRVGSDAELRVHARASAIETLHYYGFGNESPEVKEIDALSVQRQLLLAPSVEFPAGAARVSLGPVLKHSFPRLEPGSRLERDRVRGSEGARQLGAEARIDAGWRDSPSLPRSGLALALRGGAYPGWTNESGFGRADVSLRAWLPLPAGAGPSVIIRAGAERVWGGYPLQEAALLGGSRSLHGYPYQRFAGDASVYGGIGLRLPLVELPVAGRGTIGTDLLAETGRVFYAGEVSNRWHPAVAARIWYLVSVGGRDYAPGLTHGWGEIRRLYLSLRVPY